MMRGNDRVERAIPRAWMRAGIALVMACALFATACSTGAKLRGQASQIQTLTDSIETRAYRCAPKELALAKAYTEFGRYELSQGNFVRAGDHLDLAETNAREADILSDFEECRDKAVAVVVKETKKTEVVEAKPTPKDRDGDGLLDGQDTCPDEPEDFDSYRDDDGCPDLDNDEDGVADTADLCPDVPGDDDGFQDEDGCPELDNDGDGIADLNDNCPDVAEDFDGFRDDDGCAELDNDDDGIADLIDQCMDEAEDYDNDQDSDGCPEERKLVKVVGDRIELGQKVFFKTGKAKIMSVSFPLLDEVAQVLIDNPSIEIRVEGHTDSRGSNRSNQRLSDRRAASVVKALAERGVAQSRMISIGYGEDRPIEDNKTKEGRAANRRVEVHITKK
jgi:outer membrane protein OmpA-like peptidoglycan-associated protein